MTGYQKNKIIFGSAGFGIKSYGFASLNPPSYSNDFLKCIFNIGITNVDTAPSYGNAEKKIGSYNKNNKDKFNIWTKVGNLTKNSHFTIDKIHKSVTKSLADLNINNIECLYLHQNDIEIMEDKYVLRALQSLKDKGNVKKAGVSIYNPSELISSLFLDVYDVVQLPVSVSNTYLYNLAKKHNCKKTLVARSVFLQGTLLNIERYNKSFNFSNDIITSVKLLKEIAYSYKIDYLGMILSYVMSLKNLSHVILSSRNKENMKEILFKSEMKLSDEIILEINTISNKEYDWTNPRNWII